jgi:hypothetical protein
MGRSTVRFMRCHRSNSDTSARAAAGASSRMVFISTSSFRELEAEASARSNAKNDATAS